MSFTKYKEYKERKTSRCGRGTGDFTAEIVNILGVKEAVIVDINESALKQASSKGFKSYKVDVAREPLPFPNNYFDVVVMVEVVEHLYDPDYAISEVRRVLKPGGFIVISTPNLAWWVNRLVLLLGFQPYFSSPSTRFNVGKLLKSPYERPGAPGHIRLFTFKAFKEFIELHGFRIITMKGSAGDHRSRYYTFIDSILSLIPSLAAEIIVIARKV
ncbi:MAG: methyltransferase domain-containing protein [Desulfurococcales archaeon]|nr:methyltransferase domain-containing protein [Desulfurococcales archaeon]